MSDPEQIKADYEALNELIVNCPEFDELEALLGGFNLFQVLKFEYGEIRHSNVLAWILDPAESHGLDDTFLKKWLMRVVHEADHNFPISAVDIDSGELVKVEVRREWENIDLLLILQWAKQKPWVVCIENKIHTKQHSAQLSRYRKIVENTFPHASQQVFLFLTRSEEPPQDAAYLPASFTQIHQALVESMRSREKAIGSEPKVLLQNYVRLLEEKFMDESDIARTALKIYQQHRRALDVIFEHRPDNLGMASSALRELLAQNSDKLGIVMAASTKFYIRFIPEIWDVPGNTQGKAWPSSNRTVVFELNISGERPYLYIVAGKAPDSWVEPIWLMSDSAPFRPSQYRQKKRPNTWCTLHIAGHSKIKVDTDEIADPAELAQRVFDWCVKSFQEPQTEQVVQIIADRLPDLEMVYHASAIQDTDSSSLPLV